MILDDIATLVKDANPTRATADIHRRAIKLIEELGEVAQAFLHVTSTVNRKQKTWDDVREEIADCLIVALDIGWTQLPTENEAPISLKIPNKTIYNPNQELNYQTIFSICYNLGLFGQSVHSFPGMARGDIIRVIDLVSKMALCPLPDRVDTTTASEVEEALFIEVQRKLLKWTTNRAIMPLVNDDADDDDDAV